MRRQKPGKHVVFTKLGVPDFGISDISVPLPKRSRKLLSILCNFWVRLGRQWNMWSDIEVGLAAAKTDREAKRAELDAVKAKVNQLSQHPGINPERLAAAQGELAAENKALATKEPKQAVVMNDYKNLKSAKCQVTEQLKKSEVEVLDLRSAVHDVRARICHSPERQRRCLAEEAETGSQLQEEHRHLQTRVEELRRKMQKAPREREALTKLKTQLLFSLAVEQQLESLVQAKDNASARRKSAEDKYHRLLKEREAVAEKKSQLNGRTALKHQAMQSQLSFKKEQLAQAKQRLEELHLERQEGVCSKDSELEVLIKDNTELQVQLEHVKRLTLKNDSLKEELRHKTNEVAKVTAELESTMTKLGCCQREKQSLQQTVSQLTGNYAGLRAEHSAVQLLLQTEQEKCSRLAESLRQSQEREAEKDQLLQDAEMMRRDLHNTLQELKGNIRVFCRVRPMLPSEEREGKRLSRIWFPDEETVELVKPDTEKVMAFPFDRVFPGSAAQAEVYEEVARVVCAGRLQRVHLRLRPDRIREDLHDGGSARPGPGLPKRLAAGADPQGPPAGVHVSAEAPEHPSLGVHNGGVIPGDLQRQCARPPVDAPPVQADRLPDQAGEGRLDDGDQRHQNDCHFFRADLRAAPACSQASGCQGHPVQRALLPLALGFPAPHHGD